MDRTKLKNYAPQARREFIQAMVDRAAFYGLTANKTEAVIEKGDVAVIGGRSFPIGVARKRKALEVRIKRHGFQQTMDAMAYTWFNRLVAIRYMELHGYLDHGYRVLSHPEGKPTPEILEHAEHLDLPSLNKHRVIDLKLAGNKEGELYRLLLTSQCNALHSAMPFLFERIDDETELLLPDNLLNSDSLIRKLVNEIDEENWQEVEIIGWLYQFYISERKDEVIGKVVASEDIPAATQLFTPNWIVKYLVQNTLGRQWLATYPQSALRQQMEYYIEPAEQTPEVQEQLKAITPNSLNPEELTLLDPACGSGHILVEAYDLFKAIYLERGYRAKDIPALILQKNIFGLEIDDRAAQLAAFALMMKARADDRRIFESNAKPNVVAIQDSKGLNAEDITHALNAPATKVGEGDVSRADIATLLSQFENGKTFGTLIQVPPKLSAKLPEILKRLDDVLTFGDLTQTSVRVLKPLLQQARLLARRYAVVVANPPYMGLRVLNAELKAFLKDHYSIVKTDLFSAFTVRCSLLGKSDSYIGIMSPHVWMYLSTHEGLRDFLLTEGTLISLIELPKSGFRGATVQVCAYVFLNKYTKGFKSSFIRLTSFDGGDEDMAFRTKQAILNHAIECMYDSSVEDFSLIPGKPFAYWISDNVKAAFLKGVPLASIAPPKHGMTTFDNDRFLRQWHEVDIARIKFDASTRQEAIASGKTWFPYRKGGSYRRWYGNESLVINWHNDGVELKQFIKDKNPNVACGEKFFFLEAITWSDVTSKSFAARYGTPGSLFDVKGSCAFPAPNDWGLLLGFMNSKLMQLFIDILNPTATSQVGDISRVPIISLKHNVSVEQTVVEELIAIAKADWDSFERSWEFKTIPLFALKTTPRLIEINYAAWTSANHHAIETMKRIEEENNRLLIAAYSLEGEYQSDIPINEVTLTVNPAYRYAGKSTEDERWNRFQQDTIEELLSYAIGCMMGRYSLDKPGLVYAHSGNEGFAPSQYTTFRADEDGIIPLLDTDWGIRDDATNRFVEFICVAWSKEHLDVNLKFVADSLSPNSGEQPRDTIRRYLSTGFYKHHLSMYKKRPIYWLFFSGKLRAFQCLVYLHRYNEGTLARMRTEYVIPLQGQITARIDQLEGDKAKATSTSHRTKIQKEQDKLKKQQAELATFEEKLKHYADMRISLDLDDGVKVNYAKFGDLLAESKAITGGKDDE